MLYGPVSMLAGAGCVVDGSDEAKFGRGGNRV